MDLTNIQALTFDVFGTLVDWRSSVIREGEQLTRARHAPEIDWAEFADKWRAGYKPAMDRVRSGDLPWTKLDALHRLILEPLLESSGLRALSETERMHLNSVWHRLDPWPDVLLGLDRLRKKFLMAPLSNGNISLLVDLSRFAGLHWDCVLSAELAQHYKPDAEVYQTAVKLLGLEPEQILMVAAHAVDLKGARGAGLGTAYIARSQEHGPYGEHATVNVGEFDLHAEDLLDLAWQLGV